MTKRLMLFCSLLLFFSCKQEHIVAPGAGLSADEQVMLSITTDIALKEAYGTPLRNLGSIGWRVHTDRNVYLGIDDTGNTLPAIIIIKNKPRQGNPEQTYFVRANFTRRTITGDNEHGYHSLNLILDKDIYGTRIKLNRQDEWYLMSLLNGRFEEQTKKMHFDPNYGIYHHVAYPALYNQWVDRTEQPLLIPWTRFELRRQEKNLSFLPQTGETLTAIAKGTLLRASIRNARTSSINISHIRFESNTLDPRMGAYNLSTLPALPQNSSAEVQHPTWEPSQAMPNMYNMDWREWKTNKFTRSMADRSTAPNDLAEKSVLIWAMPVQPANGASPITRLYARMNRSTNDQPLIWETSSTPLHDMVLQFEATVR